MAASRVWGVSLVEKLVGVAEIHVQDAGVYFLVADDVVVYVGQSVAVSRRALEHVGRFYFDRIFWVKVAVEDLDATESTFIRLFSPRYNIRDYDIGRLVCFEKSLGVRTVGELLGIEKSRLFFTRNVGKTTLERWFSLVDELGLDSTTIDAQRY